MTRRKVRLMRMWVKTDYSAEEGAECIGSFSGPFMVEDLDQIVDVDWSVPGEVQITLAVPDPNG